MTNVCRCLDGAAASAEVPVKPEGVAAKVFPMMLVLHTRFT